MTVKKFRVGARTILSLGRESIKDHVTAVIELIKNSYDAGASVVEITIQSASANPDERWIRIADNGSGMTDAVVTDCWLRIGYSAKRMQERTGDRRRLGEKGVGRLSADRLGTHLTLRSQSQQAPPCGIRVDWSRFESDAVDITEVELDSLDHVNFQVPVPWSPVPSNERSAPGESHRVVPPAPNGSNVTGTELLIKGLRQRWTEADVRKLELDLSQLVNPLADLGLNDFQIRLFTDVMPDLPPVVTAHDAHPAQINGTYDIHDGQIRIVYSTRTGEPSTVSIPIEQFMHRRTKRRAIGGSDPLADAGERIEFITFRDVGDLRIQLRIYTLNTKIDASLDRANLETYLERFSGIRIYRDHVRVLPYGDAAKPEGDWLGLGNRKARARDAINRLAWRVEPSRVVGAVAITRDGNPHLTDVAGREGLVANDAFRALEQLVSACLRDLEIQYHDYRKAIDSKSVAPTEPVENDPNPAQAVKAFNRSVEEIKSGLSAIERELPQTGRQRADLLRQTLESTQRKAEQIAKTITAIQQEAIVYRGLATLGIAHASFGHEIQLAAGQLRESLYTARLVLPANPAAADSEITKAITYSDRIRSWGKYTIDRVHAHKRERLTLDVAQTIRDIVEDLRENFERKSVSLTMGHTDPVIATAYIMDVESVIINLLTNAYDFARTGTASRGSVRIDLVAETREEQEGYAIRVADSGPGVADHLKQRIWRALYTTKCHDDGTLRGTGLGLTIVDAIVKDYHGFRDVTSDPALGGALFDIWLPSTPK